MDDYPDMVVSPQGYSPEWSDGSDPLRAENGRLWIYRSYDVEHVTMTITHPAISWEEEETLRNFYETHKNQDVRYTDPRSGQVYAVQMVRPPRIARMHGGMLADIQVTLMGVKE